MVVSRIIEVYDNEVNPRSMWFAGGSHGRRWMTARLDGARRRMWKTDIFSLRFYVH